MNPSPVLEKDEVRQSSKSKSNFILAVILIAVAIILVAAWFSSVLVSNKVRAAHAATSTAGIVNAIMLYEAEYGVLPKIGNGTVATKPSLIDILTGNDSVNNPKRLAFFEAKLAKAARPPRGGMIPHGRGSMSLVDPWGNHYMVRLDDDGDGFIDDPAGGKPIAAKVICWSYGRPPTREQHRSATLNVADEWIKSW